METHVRVYIQLAGESKESRTARPGSASSGHAGTAKSKRLLGGKAGAGLVPLSARGLNPIAPLAGSGHDMKMAAGAPLPDIKKGNILGLCVLHVYCT
jgi:hypothetical protein